MCSRLGVVCNQLTMNGLSRLLALALLAASIATAQEPVLVALPQTEPVARAGAPFRVTYEVTWRGAADGYVILPVEVGPIDWGVATPARTVATVRDGVHVVSQTVEFDARDGGTLEAGDYDVPEVAVKYVAGNRRGAWEVAPSGSAKTDGSKFEHRLTTDGFVVRVAPRRMSFFALGGLAALLVLVVLAALAVRRFFRRRVLDVGDAVAGGADTVEGLLHGARQRRLDGQFYEFYVALGRAVSLADGGGETSDLRAKLAAWAKETGYRGARPTEDEMDGAQREVDRALAQQDRDGD